MLRKISAILFDKDGTLLDYHLSWCPINERTVLHAARGDRKLATRLLVVGGADPATGRVRSGSLFAAGTTQEIAAAFVAAGSPFDVDALTADIDRIFCAGVEGVVPVTDLAGLFSRLKRRGLKLGIASSDSASAIRATARRFAFAEHVDFMAGYDSRHGAKPTPGMLLAFAREVDVPLPEIAVVGDNVADMQMADAGGAGLKIAVLTGTSTAGDFIGSADLCLPSIAELEAALFGEH